MKSIKRGKSISVVEVLNVSKFGIWILVEDHEYFAAFEEFPWFKEATIADILAVEYPHQGHLYWPTLDVDLAVASLENPAAFPLKAKSSKAPRVKQSR